MNGFLKVIGSNNQILPVGIEYNAADLVANKLIVNWRAMDSGTAAPVSSQDVSIPRTSNVILRRHKA